MIKNLPAMWETQPLSLGWEDPMEKEIATLSRILVWIIPWTEEPGGYSPWGSQSVGHNLVSNTFTSHNPTIIVLLGACLRHPGTLPLVLDGIPEALRCSQASFCSHFRPGTGHSPRNLGSYPWGVTYRNKTWVLAEPVDAERPLILGPGNELSWKILFLKARSLYMCLVLETSSIGSCSLAPSSAYSLSPQCESQLPTPSVCCLPCSLLAWTMSVLGS